jgi:hypothetical protein
VLAKELAGAGKVLVQRNHRSIVCLALVTSRDACCASSAARLSDRALTDADCSPAPGMRVPRAPL